MKKIYLIGVLLFVGILGFSQNRMSQEQYNSLTAQEKSLYDRVLEDEEKRKKRVQEFLSKHEDVKDVIKKDHGGVKVLYDIIDNVPMYMETYNVDSAFASNTDALQPGGALNLDLDGSNIKVGVWDGGPAQADHPEFTDESGNNSRINIFDIADTGGGGLPNGHSSHVTGTIAAKGADPLARGMAVGVEIDSYNFINDNSEMIASASSPLPILLSNHSYGFTLNSGTPSWYPGAYDSEARTVDEIAATYPAYTMVFSGGNAGNTTYSGGLFQGYDKLTGNKNAKNNIVVASANPSLNPSTNDVFLLPISSFSSQGPTDDLRIKPDIAADGSNVYSSFPGSGYGTISGTSMAAPVVTGSLTLLQQYWSQLNNGEYMNSSTLKGLICHTARDDNDTAGPDPIFGWGLLDTEKAAQTITNTVNSAAIIEENTLVNNNSYTMNFSAGAGDILKATICWTDVPGIVQTDDSLNDPTPRLVNDLDLRLTKDGVDYFPWKLDYDPGTGFSNSKADNSVDNIEIVEITAPMSGSYTLTVTHKGSLQTLDPFAFPKSQDFALILTGNNINLSTSDNQLSEISVYPNPAVRSVFFEGLTTQVKYEIYGINGKALKNGEIDAQNNQVNIENLENGLYFVRLFNENMSSTHKIIKK